MNGIFQQTKVKCSTMQQYDREQVIDYTAMIISLICEAISHKRYFKRNIAQCIVLKVFFLIFGPLFATF